MSQKPYIVYLDPDTAFGEEVLMYADNVPLVTCDVSSLDGRAAIGLRGDAMDGIALLPCPFCGGESDISDEGIGTEPERYWAYCSNPACFVEGTAAYATEAEATAAWNTRAQTVFGLTLDEVRQMMKRDAERERTCKREKHGTKMDGSPKLRCSLCGYGIGDKRWSYCPNCGARIEVGDA